MVKSRLYLDTAEFYKCSLNENTNKYQLKNFVNHLRSFCSVTHNKICGTRRHMLDSCGSTTSCDEYVKYISCSKLMASNLKLFKVFCVAYYEMF